MEGIYLNGQKIKRVRKERGYKLSEIAEKTGYTASFLSQIERNIKRPSLEALRKISDSLDVPVMTFLMEEHDKNIVITEDMNDKYDKCFYIEKNNRRKVEVPEIGTLYQFITPTSSNEVTRPKMVGFYIELNPKCGISEKMIRHDSEESIYVVKGQIEAYVDDKKQLLSTGDSLYINGNVLHNYINIGDEVAIIICYLTPPVY
jgi:transcriptional regulator with XRE-family HTH domain